MMDNCCAPQWADLMHSPQMFCDDYFEREHEVHEPQVNLKCIKRTDLPTPHKDVYDSSSNETKFDDSLEYEPPANTAYFIPHDPKKEMENAKKESEIRHLKMSEKSNKIIQSWNISTTELTSAFQVSTVEDNRKPMLPERIRRRLMEPKRIQPRNAKKDNLHGKKQTETDIPEEMPCKTVSKTDKSSLSKKRHLVGRSQPKVLTCQYRRRSLLHRRRSNKFVSLAEAVSKYQNGTPDRFRTLSNKVDPLKRVKRSSMKLTLPVSPAWTYKKRAKQATVLSQEEREKLEIEEMKKNQIKPIPLPVHILKGPSVLKKMPKKPPTVAKEFHFSQPRRKTNEDEGNSGTNDVVETKDDSEPISKRTRQTMHAIQEKSTNKEQKNGAVTRSISSSKENACADSPGKRARHTLNVNVQDNKKELVARSTGASNVATRKENAGTDSPGKKARHTVLHVNTQENKKQKASAPIARSTSASNVVTRKETTDSSNKKPLHTQESNEKEKRAGVPVTRSVSASNIKKSNASAVSSAKKTRHTVLHRSMQENKQKKEVPIVRSVSASSINRKKETFEPKHNFEARNKEFQAKREEKLKSLQEMNKVKAEFHARPAPKFARPALAVKEPKKKPVIATCPFSFEQRNVNSAKKKEELVKQKQEEASKAYVFHANPAPNFKPVTLPGRSKERSKEKDRKRAQSCSDQENRQPNVMVNADKKPETKSANKPENKTVKSNADAKKSAKFELKTDKRAKNRIEFDEKLKKKEQEMAMKKSEEEKNRLLQEKMQIAEMRRMMEPKARPMPVYKPMVAVKSTKPPTSPRSPALGIRNRAKTTS